MGAIKELIDFLKKIARIIYHPSNHWYGDFKSWQEAMHSSTGYDNEVVLEKCATAILKVKSGEVAYERDSVTFDKIQYSWPLLAGLQHVCISSNDRLSVLDFGGSLGSSYIQNRSFFATIGTFEWSIVEQKMFVETGRNLVSDEHLSFYSRIEDCLEVRRPNVLLLSNVIQYLEKPYDWIDTFVNLRFEYIILESIPLIESNRDILTVQRVSKKIYDASYPCWFFNKTKILKPFLTYYELIVETENGFTPKGSLGFKNISWEGAILKRK